MGSFLENLKKDLDTGEFNSEAAKKIIEIDKLADEKKNAEQLIEKRLEDIGIKKVGEEDVEILNSEYEERMEKIVRSDSANSIVADLVNKEEHILMSIKEMIDLANDAKEEFAAEFEAKDPAFSDLLAKINHINMEYNNSIFNNLNK
jgi:hypothetical protein